MKNGREREREKEAKEAKEAKDKKTNAPCTFRNTRKLHERSNKNLALARQVSFGYISEREGEKKGNNSRGFARFPETQETYIRKISQSARIYIYIQTKGGASDSESGGIVRK